MMNRKKCVYDMQIKAMLLKDMKSAIKNKDFSLAFLYARDLSEISYVEYKNEIIECCKACAEAGNIDAMIYMADLYTDFYMGIPKKEAYFYLCKLANLGYIRAFCRLGDCYRFGIGCEIKEKLAKYYYFLSVIFDEYSICKSYLMDEYKELRSYDRDIWIDIIRRDIIYGDIFEGNLARIRLAQMILDGEFWDLSNKAAYILLKMSYISDEEFPEMYDGVPYYYLGKCFLYGWGTEKDIYLAEYFLKHALKDMEYRVYGEYIPIDADIYYYDNLDFPEMYDDIHEMLKEVKTLIKEQTDTYPGINDAEARLHIWKSHEDRFIKNVPGFRPYSDYCFEWWQSRRC